MNSRGRRSIFTLILTGTLATLVGACSDLTVPDLNNPSVSDLTENPTAAVIATATQGLLATTRDNVASMVEFLGPMGREGYAMSQDGAELVGIVATPLNGANFPGNTLWGTPYEAVRNANLILAAVDAVTGLSDDHKAGIRGFTKTLQAYNFLNIIVTRDKYGAPIDVGGDATGDPAPFASKAEVYSHIIQLLDDGQQDLQAAGSSFAFDVTSGLSDFSTPAEFLEVNRALRARVAAYTEDWQGVLTALQASFIDTTRSLDYGAYHTFSTNAGDQVNPLNDPSFFYAHTRIRADAQQRGDGSLDLRAQNKVREVASFTVSGVTSNLVFTIYDSPDSPLPWIRNEELILLRAEAHLNLSQTDAAREDINFIRVHSGGLDPITTTDPAALLDELLYNRFYSLMWEYGHTWIDMRRYGRLDQIPTGTGDPLVFDAMPVPESECSPRDSRPAGCGQIGGI